MRDDVPPGNQTHQPQYGEDQDRQQKQFGIVQEGKCVVSQESDVGVIDQCGKIECVPEERGEEVRRAAGEEGQQEELEDVEMEVKWEEGAV